MRQAIYPGTFDPVTNGHHEIIRRGCSLVDKLYVAVSSNDTKKPEISLSQRKQLIIDDLNNYSESNRIKIQVITLTGLLVHLAVKRNAKIILRGLRAISDFEFEVQMAGLNYRIDNSVETIFLSASEANQFVSSRLVREIASLGGDVSSFVSSNVNNYLLNYYKNKQDKSN